MYHEILMAIVTLTGSVTGEKILEVLSDYLNKIIVTNVVNLFVGV
jgi:hypothetical protein